MTSAGDRRRAPLTISPDPSPRGVPTQREPWPKGLTGKMRTRALFSMVVGVMGSLYRIHLSVRSFVCVFVRSLVHLFVRSFVHPFVRSLVRSLIRLLVRSFVRLVFLENATKMRLQKCERGACKSVLLCGALIVRPKDVVLAFAIWCVSRNRKCFASRGMACSFKRCSFGFCYLVRSAGP